MTDAEIIADLRRQLAQSELARLSAEATARRKEARIVTLEMMLRDTGSVVTDRING